MSTATATPPPIETRPLTGQPSWPVGLLAGVEGSGKTYTAIAASASDLVGRTFLIVVGEQNPDEYALVPGQRVELVKHDGTYRGILSACEAAAGQPRGADGKPNLIIVDSVSKLWALLSDSAQETANERARKKDRYVGEDGADVGRDIWNTATSRWYNVLEALKAHDGPVLLTARLDYISGTDERTGQPTKEKFWKPVGQKMLSYEVGFIVQFRASFPESDTYLSKVTSLRFKHKTDRNGKPVFEPVGDFTVEGLWRKLGLDGDEVAARTYAHTVVQSDRQQTVERDELLAAVLAAAESAGVASGVVAQRWAETHNGQRIDQTADLAGLAEVRDTLLARAQERAAQQQPPQEPQAPDAAHAQPAQEQPPAREPSAQAAQVSAHAQPSERAPQAESPHQKMMRMTVEELTYQADALGVPYAEHVKPTLADQADLDSIVPAKVTPYVIKHRGPVIDLLRAHGRATEADAYELMGDAPFIVMERITEAERFTREEAEPVRA